jgi:hypothetical protein
MYQPWIFGTVMATGAGLVALTVSLQRPPAPATAERFDFDAVRVVPPPLPSTVEAPQAPSPLLELEPVVIHGRTHRAVAAPTPPAQDKLAEKPCSAWRELGPTHVVAGTPSGDLSVRQLCE